MNEKPFSNNENISPENALNNQSFADGLSNGMETMWEDINSLGTILVISTLVGCFLIHHVDLRQRLMGARMRIACCSLIYRKVGILNYNKLPSLINVSYVYFRP